MKFLAIPQNSVMIRVIESSIEKTRTSWDAVDQSWIREENAGPLTTLTVTPPSLRLYLCP